MELRSYDIEPRCSPPPTYQCRTGGAAIAGTQSCGTRPNARLADHQRDIVDVLPQASGFPIWVVDALRAGFGRSADLFNKQHGHAYAEPERRSASQSVRDANKRR